MLELTPTDKRIIEKLGQLAQRHAELEEKMNEPAVASKPAELIKFAKEHGKLAALTAAYRKLASLQEQLDQAQALLDDPEMAQIAAEEVQTLNEAAARVLIDAKEKLVMSEDASIDSVIVEIRAGTGGDEAALFAGDLYGMYSRYADSRGWKVEPMSFSPTELGGYREIIFSVKGDGVWQALGYEGGGHRVQRVPETEAQGRIHTSAATVAVLPEPEEIEIDIKPDEVIEHVARSSGPGGQNVNKVNSAIKLEHIPTGITVSMQDEKSQHKNRAKAWRILRSRVYEKLQAEKHAARSEARKTMIGSGDRSQRIRTYNFPQNRLTDHRINFTAYNLDKVMMGELNELIQALSDYDKEQRLAAI